MKSLMLVTSILFFIKATFANSVGVDFQNVSFEGSGCPEGTASVAATEDKKSVSVMFDEFMVELPNILGDDDSAQYDGVASSIPVGVRRPEFSYLSYRMCKMTIDAIIPEGYKTTGIEIALDFRGTTQLEVGALAKFQSVLMKYNGPRGLHRVRMERIEDKVWNGLRNEVDQDWEVNTTKLVSVPSGCAASAQRKVQIVLRNSLVARFRDTRQTEGFALVMMDSADLTSRVKVGLNLEPCAHGRSSGYGNSRSNRPTRSTRPGRSGRNRRPVMSCSVVRGRRYCTRS